MTKWTGDDVTVVITTIPGRDKLLQRAFASVQAQTVEPAAVQITNDIERHGATWARNHALEHVETEWVAWLDDDDELLPKHLQKMLAGANFSNADLIYTYAEFVGGRDPLAVSFAGHIIAQPIDIPWSPAVEHSLREFGNFIPVTNLVRTSAMRTIGGFPEKNGFNAKVSRDCEDYGLLLALLDAGFTFYHVCGVRTWRYHFWSGNTGGRGLTE